MKRAAGWLALHAAAGCLTLSACYGPGWGPGPGSAGSGGDGSGDTGGTGNTGGSGGGGSGGTGGGSQECPRDAYPGGPYGTSEGSVIADLEFDAPTGGTVSLSDYFLNDSKHLLYVVTAAGWCFPCIAEQPTLQEWHQEYSGQGLQIMETVFEDSNAVPADAAYAATWIDSHDVTFPVLADPDFVLQPFYPNNDATVTPLNLLIDLCSMRVVDLWVGATDAAPRIEAHL